MNISEHTHSCYTNEVVPDTHSSRSDPANKTSAEFDIFDISNHHKQDKIVPKNIHLRNEFQFEGTADDMKAQRGNVQEMDSLHLAKKRHVSSIDKGKLDPEDCDEEVDDFEEDSGAFGTCTTPSKRLSLKGRTRSRSIAEEDNETTKRDFRKRVEDSLCVDSIHLNKKRLEESS